MPPKRRAAQTKSPPPVPAKQANAYPPPTKGEATRATLLGVAHKLFLTQGFHGTSMREIADEAGVAVGGIYNHFATKEDIFAAVLDAFHPYHVLLPALEETQGDTVETFVRDAAHRVRDGVAGAETRLMPLIFMELLEFRGRHLKQLADTMLPKFLVFIQRFARLPGPLRAIPVPILLRTFMCLVVGYMMSELLLRQSKVAKQFNLSAEQWFDGMVDIYLHGILDEGNA